MVATYSDATKLKHAHSIAQEANYFIAVIVEKKLARNGGLVQKTCYILYRKGGMRNERVGKRSSIDAILRLVKAATK